MKQSITKPKNVSYNRVPHKLWRLLKKHLPKVRKAGDPGPGRHACANRNVLNGIWHVLWTGCQWKSIEKEWFGASSSVLHDRFQEWTNSGVFLDMLIALMRYYHRRCHIRWTWQSADSRSVPAPLGGKGTGPNPTDRAKRGGKIHILVDQRGAPLAVDVFGANQNEKWHIAALILSILVHHPGGVQHLCLDKAYDSWEVHIEVKELGYIPHIKHRRRVNEPKTEDGPAPGETVYPPKRWVAERTLGWVGRRRSIRTRWSIKPTNWLAFIHLACADILFSYATYF